MAADLPISEDKSFIRLVADIYGAELHEILRGINLAGGEAFGLAELIEVDHDGDPQVVRAVHLG